MPLKSISCGQKIRVALAKALIENPDLLLLDEPTNHLDADMFLWLQSTLSSRKGATVIVSHDRKFINAVCNHVVEIKNRKLRSYGGDYNFYLNESRQEIERQIKAYEAMEEEKKLLKTKIKAMTGSKAKKAAPSDRNIMGVFD